MKPSVADIDWKQLNERERWTLENVRPLLEDGYDEAQAARELNVDRDQLAADVENLAARIVALSGQIVIPQHSEEEYEALKASIAEHGQSYPILRGSPTSARPGEIIDGNARLRICRELGLAPKYMEADGDADYLQSLEVVLNVARRHLNAASRRGIIKAELLRHPSRSDVAIATAAGVSDKTVANVRRDLEATSEIPRSQQRTGRDGKARPATAEPRPPAAERAIRVLVDADSFDTLVGPWVPCTAFRLVERRPGVHELQVKELDSAPAGEQLQQAFHTAAAAFAQAMERTPAETEHELLENASEVFGRPITVAGDLSVDEAKWAIKRLGELTELATA